MLYFYEINNMENTENVKFESLTLLRNKWYWFLIAGIICLGGGVFSLYQPFFATLTVEMLVAWIFIFSGIINIVHTFQINDQKGKYWAIAWGVLSVLIGIVLILRPLEGIISLTLMIATLLVACGTLQIFYAYQLHSLRGWGWLLLGGIIAVLLGSVIFIQIDELAGVALGTFLAINLIMNGTALVLASFAIKNFKES